MAAFLDSSTVHRSVWCKQRTRGFWEAAKSGILGENWWRDNLRMKKQTFCLLCLELKPFLIKQVTRFRLPIDVDEQVAIMLWRLATNTEYRTIAALFGVGISTVCSIVHKTAQIVVEFLLPKYVCIPLEDKLKEIVAEFESLWGFPQVVGAIDGTHIPILHPQESPSDYYNRKNFYSIIMQAVVDSRCCFVDVNIGWPGKVHDARVLSNSSFFWKANEGSLFPNWKRKINGVDIPLLILGDPAYPLMSWLMKCYPETGCLSPEESHFNYRQSRARMVVENAFGRLKGRWRCLLKRMDYMNIDTIINVVACCVVLHNICEFSGDRCDTEWISSNRQSQVYSATAPVRGANTTANGIRDALKEYLYNNK